MAFGGYGAGASNVFGGAGGGAFGAPAQGAFGAPQAAGGFGAPPASAVGAFGAPAAAPGGFGVPAASGGFGAPAAGTFGAPAAGAYGAPAAPGFGAPAASAGFGGGGGGGAAAGPLGGPAPAAPIAECAGRPLGDTSVALDAAGAALDTISSISWSPSGKHLCTAGWDGKVRVFGLNQSPPSPNAGATGKAVQEGAGAPVLDAKFMAEDQIVLCGLNRMVQVWNLVSNTLTPLGVHDAGVRNVATIPEMGAIVSVGWDRALRVFDLRAGKCVHVIQLAAKPHAMDAAKDLIVVAEGQIKSGSGRGHKGYAGAVELFNLRSLPRPERQMESPLRMQTRCVRVFPDATSFVIGSVEGRCGFRLRDPTADATRGSGAFNFRCHRDTSGRVYAVNAIDVQPEGTPGRSFPHAFATGGANGTVTFWDRQAQSRSCDQWPGRMQTPVTAIKFDPTGYYMAYAHGYDWSKGAKPREAQASTWGPSVTSLHIHDVTNDDMTPRRR